MGEYASRLLKDFRVQLESIISRPITLCPPSISANSSVREYVFYVFFFFRFQKNMTFYVFLKLRIKKS